jgi:hypothetical protein
VDFHSDHAVHQPLLSEIAELIEILELRGPEDEVVVVFFGDLGGGYEFEFGDTESALEGGEKQGEDAYAFAGQPAGHGVGLVSEFLHGGEDPLAGFLGNGARAVDRLRNRAQRYIGPFGHIRHGRHEKL